MQASALRGALPLQWVGATSPPRAETLPHCGALGALWAALCLQTLPSQAAQSTRTPQVNLEPEVAFSLSPSPITRAPLHPLPYPRAASPEPTLILSIPASIRSCSTSFLAWAMLLVADIVCHGGGGVHQHLDAGRETLEKGTLGSCPALPISRGGRGQNSPPLFGDRHPQAQGGIDTRCPREGGFG